MNYPYPIPGSQANPAAFVADNTLDLGSYAKPLDARALITVDYSQLVPAVTLKGYSFRIRPGGEPQLRLENSTLSGASLSFYVNGGIGGRAYEVAIVVKLANTETRTDMLTVQVLGDDCGCALLPPPPAQGVVSGDGSVIVNDLPRFFVSATIPVGANVLDRWYNVVNGEVYDYISNGLSTLWQLAGGGGGGGGIGSNVAVINIVPIMPDGVTTLFTLSAIGGAPVNIASSATLFVSVDGVWQDSQTQYYAVGNQIQFAQPPSADSAVFMVWFAPAP